MHFVKMQVFAKKLQFYILILVKQVILFILLFLSQHLFRIPKNFVEQS